MLTIFAVPKPFQGHIGMIQRNAIRSWLALRPRCQVILLGDEEGTADVARTFGVTHVGAVARNEYGTPLLNDVFQQAETLASHDLMCYLNCDIIMGSALLPAIEQVQRMKKRFLIIGQCWDLDVDESLPYEDPLFELRLKQQAQTAGQLRSVHCKDYFVSPRGLYQDPPPFALGRAFFDCWLVWKALKGKAAVVDATSVVMAVHQNHTYAHLAGGFSESRHGKEANRNVELAGGPSHGRAIWDANYRLTRNGLKWNGRRFLRVDDRLDQLRWARIVLERTRGLRHVFGLNLHNFRRLKAYFIRG